MRKRNAYLSKLIESPIFFLYIVFFQPRDSICVVHPFERPFGGLEVLCRKQKRKVYKETTNLKMPISQKIYSPLLKKILFVIVTGVELKTSPSQAGAMPLSKISDPKDSFRAGNYANTPPVKIISGHPP